MEKLCSKMKASLELISSKITIFLKSFDFKTIHSKFKYNISYIQINDQFLIHLICYVISKQMQILDIALQHQCTILKAIREDYNSTSITLQKNSRNFQMWFICVTKIIASFYYNSFKDLDVNEDLQSQIYLILVHCLIGLKVNKKSYELIHRKYCQLNPKEQVPRCERKKNEGGRKSKNLMEQKSVILKKKKTLQSSQSEKQASTNTDFQQLQKYLKATFHLNSLPKLKNSKRGTMNGFSQNNLTTLQVSTKQYEAKMRKTVISSNQHSSSFETQLLDHDIGIVTQQRGFKIPHRIQFKDHHESCKKKQEYQDLSFGWKPPKKQLEAQKNKTSQDWLDLISSIRSKKCDKPQKLQLESLFLLYDQKQNQPHSNTQIQDFRQNKTWHINPSQTYCRKTEQHKDKLPPKQLDYLVKNFKETAPVVLNYFDKKIPNKMIKLDRLKAEQRKFQAKNMQRKKNIEYSIFKLPKPEEPISFKG